VGGDRPGSEANQARRKKKGETRERERWNTAVDLTRITRLEGVEGRRADVRVGSGCGREGVTGNGKKF
jgi:hypothetical protein